ncbi:MAG: NIL domain-containing protein [Candidatus Omnitrophica bacterium]|nr:NIL domain-containing protein [Candidatus Omnitrophota bacterium]HOX54615.1 NIL domain-containing protein [Candidatus Omnitrophota bacterium]
MRLKVELTFPGQLKDEPIIYYMGQKYKVIPNIIEASFSTKTGWALLVLEGEQAEIDKALEYVKNKNIGINLLGNV